ncbi:MAG: hypothetical protein ACI9PP_000057 [Halobacteriales archaeon]
MGSDAQRFPDVDPKTGIKIQSLRFGWVVVDRLWGITVLPGFLE